MIFQLNNNNQESLLPIKSQFTESLFRKINNQFSTIGFTFPENITSRIVEEIFDSINLNLTNNVRKKIFKDFCFVCESNGYLCEFLGDAKFRITLTSIDSNSFILFDGFITLNSRRVSKSKEIILSNFIQAIEPKELYSKVDEIMMNYSETDIINDKLLSLINSNLNNKKITTVTQNQINIA